MFDELGPIAVGNGFLALEPIPIRHRARIMQALFCARREATQDLFAQIAAIILGGRLENCLENNTLVALADIFHCGKHRNAVLLEFVFIEGAVVSVPGKTVKFPDDHAIELPLFAVVDHALKIRPLVRLAADRAVGVDTDDHEPAPFGIHNDFEADLEKLHLRYGVGGFDAADSVDLNAAVALGMIPGDPHIYARAMFWLPEDVLAAQTTDGNRRERDEAPYLLWERQGLLRSYPGSKVDKHVFLDWFRELRDDDDFYIIYIAYDPWHIDDTLLREFKQEFGERCMIPVRQGSLTLSAPMKELKADLAAGRIVHNNNPVLQMCLTNTEVLADTNGNIKPIKGIDLTQRIDGTIALICAYIALINHYDDLQAVI